jgi:hypothetical protein
MTVCVAAISINMIFGASSFPALAGWRALPTLRAQRKGLRGQLQAFSLALWE